MSVLLLRLAGPMQSWGVQSRFGVRDTGLEPSKSGVVGLLCAALGRDRHEPIADLAALEIGVRVDCEGRLLRDYHTAGKGGYLAAGGKVVRRNLIVSTRYYLADARFLVGLEGKDHELLTRLHCALRDPHWPLYLGRKAFPPGEPVWLRDSLRANERLLDALKTYPWLGWDADKKTDAVRVVMADPDGSETRPDQPLSFAERRFVLRRVSTTYIPVPPVNEEPCT